MWKPSKQCRSNLFLKLYRCTDLWLIIYCSHVTINAADLLYSHVTDDGGQQTTGGLRRHWVNKPEILCQRSDLRIRGNEGTIVAQIGHSEEANKCLRASVQLNDDIIQNWALWGEYLYQLFEKDRNLTLGLSVVTCYLQALHGLNVIKGKARKYLACVINMLSYDDEKGTLAEVGVGAWCHYCCVLFLAFL